MKKKINTTTTYFLMLFISCKSYCSPLTHTEIETLAENFLRENITIPKQGKLTIEINNIDRRLDIKNCSLPLVASLSTKTNRRNVNIKVSCTTAPLWKMYLSAKVSLTIPVVIAQQALDKNTLLTRDNIIVAYIDNYKIRGTHLSEAELLYGSKTTKNVSKGYNLTQNNTCMVCKNQPVSIIAQSSNFVIKTEGMAISNGHLGEAVRVKNLKTGKIISAKVQTVNKVVINLE